MGVREGVVLLVIRPRSSKSLLQIKIYSLLTKHTLQRNNTHPVQLSRLRASVPHHDAKEATLNDPGTVEEPRTQDRKLFSRDDRLG